MLIAFYQPLVLSLLHNLNIYDPVNMFNSEITVFVELRFQKAYNPLMKNYVSKVRNSRYFVVWMLWDKYFCLEYCDKQNDVCQN